MSEYVRSAARVLDILEYFADGERSANLAAVTSAFGIPKSSAYGLLRTLHVRGYLIKDEEGQYQLNKDFRKHGFGWEGAYMVQVLARAEPIMVTLAEELGETINIGTLTNDGQIAIIKQVMANQSVRYDVPMNRMYPAYCSAIGRVLLSRQPAEMRARLLQRQPLNAVTPFTNTSLDSIQEIISEAVATDYCVVCDEFDLGGTGVATAIQSDPGRPAIALNASCVTARFENKRDMVISALLRDKKKLLQIFSDIK